jgi:hypothetical protein
MFLRLNLMITRCEKKNGAIKSAATKPMTLMFDIAFLSTPPSNQNPAHGLLRHQTCPVTAPYLVTD